MYCYTIIQYKYNSMITIECKYNIVSNRTNLIRTSNKYPSVFYLQELFAMISLSYHIKKLCERLLQVAVFIQYKMKTPGHNTSMNV